MIRKKNTKPLILLKAKNNSISKNILWINNRDNTNILLYIPICKILYTFTYGPGKNY